MRILLWYRNDLRLHDHEALHRAIGQKPTVIVPLYCFDPRQWWSTGFGFRKTGAFRTQFLLESVADLRAGWQRLQSNLVVRQGQPEEIIPQLVKQHDIDAVYYHEEVASEERSVERALRKSLDSRVAIKTFWAHTLYHPGDLPFAMNALPELFTTFRKEVEKAASVQPALAAPTVVPPLPDIEPGELPTLAELGMEPVPADARAVLKFSGGETAGLARLDEYIWKQDCLRVYKETRNGMKGANDSTKFSPWLAHGCLSPRMISENVQHYESQRVSNDSTYWLIFELLWRDYFRFIAKKHGNRIFHRAGLQRTEIPWVEDPVLFDAWRNGQTGYPLIDANMRELAATGYMSNRGRQNVASFLTKNLGVDWRMGAEWFESLLLDYDVSSNWGNWVYAAGVGNDARGFRYFNITKQARDYDLKGDYVRHWLPELAQVPGDLVHEPWKLSAEQQQRYGVKIGVDYPRPIVDLFQSAAQNEEIYNRAFKPAAQPYSNRGKPDRSRSDRRKPYRADSDYS